MSIVNSKVFLPIYRICLSALSTVAQGSAQDIVSGGEGKHCMNLNINFLHH